jgi:phosphoglycerate kinase
MSKITYIDETNITGKRVLVRVDYNVSFKKDGSGEINDDTRIKNSLPSLKLLLQNKNRLILMSHLGKPKGRDTAFSMKPVAERLQEYLPDFHVTLVDDFMSPGEIFAQQSEKDILVLENTRFYEGEKKNDPEFSKKLAGLADVFVSDAFGSVHRAHASVVGVASYLPSYGGLLLKQEVKSILQAIENPRRPVVAIIAGAKISTKIGLIERLMEIADSVLIGGAMTNNFLKAQGREIGKGLIEEEFVEEAKRLLQSPNAPKKLTLPVDRRIGRTDDTGTEPVVKKVTGITPEDETLDIGPETEKIYADIISKAATTIWNGPVGYFENPRFAGGSLAIFHAIVANPEAVSVVGGGDTLAVIKKQQDKGKITHISTGGGAMLELIEKGTLPGIEALKK